MGFFMMRETMDRGRTRTRSALLSLLLCAGCVACAPESVTIRSHPEFAPRTITTVAIAPFRALPGSRDVYQTVGRIPPPDLDNPEIRQSLRAPTSPVPLRSRATKVSVLDFVPGMVQHMVYSQLNLNPHVRTIPPETVSQILNREDDSVRSRDPQAASRLLGQRLAVDAVVDGMIRVYREREGTRFGAAVTAAVGFELRLLNAQDGRVLWVGDYFEEQKPLTDDFTGFVKRGGEFVTAEELARSGVIRVLERLPLGEK